MLALVTRISAITIALTLSACPWGSSETIVEHPAAPPPKAATHTGLVSIQDMSIANLPQAGHGLTVQAFFTRLRAPDFIEPVPGTPFGCQASAYDLSQETPPAQEDQGTLEIAGLNRGDIRCVFREDRGYVCPTANGAGRAEVSPAQGTSSYALEGLALSEADIGRYLQISGADNANNNGAFAIIAVDKAHGVTVANPRAVAETFAASYAVVAGAGPTPQDLYEPFLDDERVSVSLSAAGSAAFDAFELDISPGGVVTLDDATAQQIGAIEPNGEAIALGCGGEGGDCGPAAASVIRITTTDGDTTGLSPAAMPPAQHWLVEVQCAFPDTGTVHVPAGAMELIRKAHERAPITRIRTAFMREGYAIATNSPPKPGNSAIVLVGHGILGFSNP